MNEPTINYPRCKFCKFAENIPIFADMGVCHFNPPVFTSHQHNIGGISSSTSKFLYPEINFKTGGCSRMQPIDVDESEFEEVESRPPKATPGSGHRWAPPPPTQKDPDEKKGL